MPGAPLWDAHGDVVCDDVRWKLRGGAWTAKVKSQAFDCFVAECSHEVASKFCSAFGLVKSASFSIRLYSEAHAQQLAEAWCRLHQSWYNVWQGRGEADEAFVFSAADLANIPPPPALAALVENGNPKAQARASAMRALRPRGIGA